jgi:hypothetical protein
VARSSVLTALRCLVPTLARSQFSSSAGRARPDFRFPVVFAAQARFLTVVFFPARRAPFRVSFAWCARRADLPPKVSCPRAGLGFCSAPVSASKSAPPVPFLVRCGSDLACSSVFCAPSVCMLVSGASIAAAGCLSCRWILSVR